jgi:hypothetical protein
VARTASYTCCDTCDTCDTCVDAETAEAKEGDRCPKCSRGKLSKARASEVGNVFDLGQQYGRDDEIPRDSAALHGTLQARGIPREMLTAELGCGSGMTCWRR